MRTTNKESQTCEYKKSWRDEYLRTICAFANTKGGTLVIGRDDRGFDVGIPEADVKKLLEDIPNKTQIMGVIVDATAKKVKSDKYLLFIKVKQYPSVISYKSRVYVRSGSTTQELNGVTLEKMLLQKRGLSWEETPEERASIDDINLETINRFRRLAENRSPSIGQEKSLEQLLEKLHLTKNGKLTRATILLFGKDPQRFYMDAYIKIGRFKDEGTLLGMDEIRGNLLEQVENAMDVLKKKYLHSDVKFTGLLRSEHLEYPEAALREALVNAIVHRDYSEVRSEINVYPESMRFWNFGGLTHGLTTEKLKRKHASFPRNKVIARVFYSAGYIDEWGHGTVRMLGECKKAGLPEPIYEESDDGLRVSFVKDLYNAEHLRKSGFNERQIRAVLYAKEYGTITNSLHQEINSVSKRTATTDLQGLIERSIFVKQGVTGKGTSYMLQWGNKGAKGANAGENEVDKKLALLEKDLEAVDPSEEIRKHFGKDTLMEIFDSWAARLLSKAIPAIQKFNHLFTGNRHWVSIRNGLGSVQFTNEPGSEIVESLRQDFLRNADRAGYHDTTLALNAFYGSFKKGGLNTFGCVYDLEVRFDHIKYEVWIDNFSTSKKDQKLWYQRLLHKPLTDLEIGKIVRHLEETIFQHIDYHTKKKGLRK